MEINIENIDTESDVEQKIIMPLLTSVLRYNDEEIKTKDYLAPTDIDKGAGKKIGYYPDYLIYLGGIPIIVGEAKDPKTNVEQGYKEARLYANEVNKLYSENINPIKYIFSCNGLELLWGPTDSEKDLKRISVSNLITGSKEYEFIVSNLSRNSLILYANKLRRLLLPTTRYNPLRLIGGPSRQNAELPHNSFAYELAPLLRKYFDPDETKWSDEILEKAYCSSDELTQYNATLEALLKDRIMRKKGFDEIKTSKKKAEIIDSALSSVIKNKRDIPDPFLLIVGGVGTGKSMFLERYQKYLINDEINKVTHWSVIDFNTAPDDLSNLENWICTEFNKDFSYRNGDDTFYDFDNIKRYFAPDLAQRENGVYKLLKDTNNEEYVKQITLDLKQWMDDPVKLSSGITRYYSKDKNLPVIAVFDNVDKRNRDQQLRIFQVVQWFRSNNNCFTILTLRDETYDAYKNEPPLDAFLKPFAFRISPPRFINVVQKRLELVINYLTENAKKKLTYILPNGFEISYPSTKLGNYLMSIYLSIFNPSRKIRLILEALSGRNTRRALEMFADILTSSYMDEGLILSITEGEKKDIPEWLIIRILMRTNYEFFREDHGYVSNIFSLPESSITANNFLILELLEYLAKRRKRISSFKIEGYYYVQDIINHMIKLGYVNEDILWALELSLNRGLLTADHQRNKGIKDTDYVKISASGYYHIRFLSSRTEYLSNISIDMFFNNQNYAKQISYFHRDNRYHTLKRLEILKKYLIEEDEKITKALPEYSLSKEAVDDQIDRISKIIEFSLNR